MLFFAEPAFLSCWRFRSGAVRLQNDSKPFEMVFLEIRTDYWGKERERSGRFGVCPPAICPAAMLAWIVPNLSASWQAGSDRRGKQKRAKFEEPCYESFATFRVPNGFLCANCGP
jgi:hypothetical protein